MKLKKCRNCHCRKLSKLFSLGKLSFTGKFPKNIKTNIKKTELTLVICERLLNLIISRKFLFFFGFENR